MQDAELLDLRHEVALLDARTCALLATMPDDADAETERPIWKEIMINVNLRVDLVAAESKRLVAMQQMVTTEQAMVLVARLTGVIREHVHDPAILAAIASDLAALTAHEDDHFDA